MSIYISKIKCHTPSRLGHRDRPSSFTSGNAYFSAYSARLVIVEKQTLWSGEQFHPRMLNVCVKDFRGVESFAVTQENYFRGSSSDKACIGNIRFSNSQT
jgi:hypothetical protein